MKKELDEALCAKYPKLFRDRNAPMTHTAMCWGFSCGDGWYDIIDRLCDKIQKHCDDIGEQTIVIQVKEKFGTLRFYVGGADDYIWNAVADAEQQSAVTCEVCGSPGVAYGGGWILTLCEEHAKERGRTELDKFEEELD